MADGAIIVKRVKKGHAAHHGGAWKVAYADFVTAMMAFFLLLWLLNAVTEEQLRGISNYFAPTSVSKTTSGGGGVLGGQTISADGAMPQDGGTPNVSLALPPPTTTGQSDKQEQSEAEKDFDIQKSSDVPVDVPQDQVASSQTQPSEQQLQQEIRRREQAQFNAAAAALRQAIQDIPDLKSLANSLLVDNTPEGLRIQLVDQNNLAMFPKGGAEMFDHTRAMLQLVAKVAAQLPEKIAISGHTDSIPFSSNSGYTNWELSTDRANAARRQLLADGLAPARIARVSGMADTQPLATNNPSDPRNRRLSIVLLRSAPLSGVTVPAAPPPPAPPPPGPPARTTAAGP